MANFGQAVPFSSPFEKVRGEKTARRSMKWNRSAQIIRERNMTKDAKKHERDRPDGGRGAAIFHGPRSVKEQIPSHTEVFAKLLNGTELRGLWG
jgi:hypothetical protein